MGKNMKVDVWDNNLSVGEYIYLVNVAKGPEELYALFLEAKRTLKEEDYYFFRKETIDQFNLLIECGAMLNKNF